MYYRLIIVNCFFFLNNLLWERKIHHYLTVFCTFRNLCWICLFQVESIHESHISFDAVRIYEIVTSCFFFHTKSNYVLLFFSRYECAEFFFTVIWADFFSQNQMQSVLFSTALCILQVHWEFYRIFRHNCTDYFKNILYTKKMNLIWTC